MKRGYSSSDRPVGDLRPPPGGPAPGARVDAKPVNTEPGSESFEEWLRARIREDFYVAMGTPLDLIDGRPWVRTHEQAHPRDFWGDGTEHGCGHADCGDTAGRNLTGLLGTPGITS